MHVIAGLPRSGSTAWCNILNQNPAFHASSTSPLPRLWASFIQILSTSPEVKGDMARNREKAEAGIKAELQALCRDHHGEHAGLVLFNKSRDWSFHLLDLFSVDPEAKAIITVRDLPGVVGSIEKQHRDSAYFNEAGALIGKTLRFKVKAMMSAEGVVGQPLLGIRDIIDRRLDEDVGDQKARVKFVKLESFSRAPKSTLARIYDFLDIPPFEHDFENIESTAEDPDWLYNWKFPHDGSGKVVATDNDEWRKFFTDEIESLIIRDPGLHPGSYDYRWFQKRFGAKRAKQEEPDSDKDGKITHVERLSTGKSR